METITPADKNRLTKAPRTLFGKILKNRRLAWLIVWPLLIVPARELPGEDLLILPTAADPALPVLTRISQIRDLSASEASRGYPVHVTGVVTYYDVPGWKQFVQDDSAGIYIATRETNHLSLIAGQKVEIQGFTGPGGYAPILYSTQLKVLGNAEFPSAKISSIQSLITGSEDSQWVAIRGVVHNQTVTNDSTVLILWTLGGSIKVSVPNATNAPAPGDFLDAAVEARGVCSTIFSARRQLQDVEVHIPDWRQFEVQETGPKDPFRLPVQPVSALLEFHAGTSGLHRSHIHGIVTRLQPDGSFFIQDESSGMLVQPKEPVPNLKPGAPLEVVGFPAVTKAMPVLQEALTKPFGKLPLPEPVILKSESRLNQDYHATLVRFDARVIAHSSHSSEEILTVEFGQALIDAALIKGTKPDQLAKIVPGSVVRLTGVYVAQWDDNRTVRSFRLLLRSSGDVAVISRPPAWTLQNTLWLLGGLAVVLSGALMWVSLLRRQVRWRTWELSKEIEEHKSTAIKLVAEVEQRKQTQSELEQKQVALKKEIEERAQAEQQLKQTHKQLLDISRQAGMAEVATGVLHNVGNVLNSVNVSAICVTDAIRKSKTANLSKVAALLSENESNLFHFLTNDSKGRQLPTYLTQLAAHLAREQTVALEELSRLQKNIEHIKEIVTMQQNFAHVSGIMEMLAPADLVEDAIKMNEISLVRHDIEIIREFAPVPSLNIEKHKALQILVNLIRNAKHACKEAAHPEKRLTIRVANGNGRIQIAVIDNGIGIPQKNLTRIFNHGFTTKTNGHGFGLHSGALAARELGGALTAQSDGPGKGATFILELPCNQN